MSESQKINVALSRETHAKLTLITRKDESYDEVVARLIDFYTDENVRMRKMLPTFREGTKPSNLLDSAPILRVLPTMSEDEILERVREYNKEVYVQRRNKVLYDAETVVSTYNPHRSHYVFQRFFKTPVPLPEQLKTELENETPAKIRKQLEDLKEMLSDFENFENNFAEWFKSHAPVNWAHYAKTIEEYVEKQKVEHAEDFVSVKEAIQYIYELMEVAEEVLREKEVFLKAHEPEIEPLVEECTKLVEQMNKLQTTIIETIKNKVSEKTSQKVAKTVEEWENLNREFDLALDRLAKITYDKPAIVGSVLRPQFLDLYKVKEFLQRR